MNDRSVTIVTHHAAAEVSRRASFTALGAAGLAAAFLGSRTADAKKSSKKKAKQKCRKQMQQCTAFLKAGCEEGSSCSDSLVCCTLLGKCDFTGFHTCLSADEMVS